jgi:hypothetical protein
MYIPFTEFHRNPLSGEKDKTFWQIYRHTEIYSLSLLPPSTSASCYSRRQLPAAYLPAHHINSPFYILSDDENPSVLPDRSSRFQCTCPMLQRFRVRFLSRRLANITNMPWPLLYAACHNHYSQLFCHLNKARRIHIITSMGDNRRGMDWQLDAGNVLLVTKSSNNSSCTYTVYSSLHNTLKSSQSSASWPSFW